MPADQSSGSLLLGGIDRSKYTGDMAVVPFTPMLPGHAVDRALVLWTSFSYTVTGADTVNFNVNMAMLIDTGTSWLVLPKPLVDNLFQKFRVNNSGSRPLISCDVGNTDANFTFGLNDDPKAQIVMPLSNLIRQKWVDDNPKKGPVVEEGRNVCTIAITPTNDIYGML